MVRRGIHGEGSEGPVRGSSEWEWWGDGSSDVEW